jgi:hypothetical protein
MFVIEYTDVLGRAKQDARAESPHGRVHGVSREGVGASPRIG